MTATKGNQHGPGGGGGVGGGVVYVHTKNPLSSTVSGQWKYVPVIQLSLYNTLLPAFHCIKYSKGNQ